ncbi:MAG: hypothetical protein KAH72_01515 [Flavobacteriaceae bacterium]|nr:hypothetical protein [Flavobacteriaceae bacterium]
MKKIFLSLVSLTVLLSADLSVEEIEKMVYKIHQKREGVKLETLATTKEPFAIGENNVTFVAAAQTVEKKEAKLVLHSIVNGKAYINDSWSSLDDIVMGYTLKFVGKRGVVLRNGNHIKKLYLRKERDNFIKLEER